ncbi:MAG: cation:proton antiporter, partial [Gammaproteobacteria bacterium]|nr:cation:proton antiporter [Gammaproteobacteria bacterium]
FTLAVLLFSIAAAWITDLSGLSLALGAFLAGMMLGETEFRHQVATDIRPFRDVLLGLFFITVGMLLDVHALPQFFHWVVLIVVGLIILKISIIFLLSLAIGSEKGVALRTGISLAQGGEFGFALLSLAFKDGLISSQASQLILASIVISMVLTPWMIRYNGAIAKRLFRESYGVSREKREEELRKDVESLTDHVIICGFGRIGQNIARFLEKEGFEYIALDLDPVRVREARQAGERVNYGDSTHAEILESAGIMRCKVLVVSYDDADSALKILQLSRGLRSTLPVLVRTRDDTNLDVLQAAGATEVIPETLEASVMLSSSVLMLLGVPVSRVVKHVQEVRSHRYQMLRQFFHGQDIIHLTDSNTIRESLHSVTIPEGAYAVGRHLSELELERCRVEINAIRRNNQAGPDPTPETRLLGGDILVLYGTPEDLEHAEAVILSGRL